jgi:hypothetical protein
MASSDPDSKWRERARRALEKYFARRSAPRLILSLILILTGLASLIVSLELLRAGLMAMWVRYPIAVLAGYGSFIGLLRLWLKFERGRFDPRAEEFESAIAPTPSPAATSNWKERLPRRRWYDWLDFPDVFDLDEGCLIALLLGVVVALIGLAVFAILSARPLSQRCSSMRSSSRFCTGACALQRVSIGWERRCAGPGYSRCSLRHS